MKILASRQSESVEDYLKHIEGKDIWVLVGLHYNTSAPVPPFRYFIRVLNVYKSGYVVNRIPDVSSLHRDGSWHCSQTQKNRALANNCFLNKDNVSIEIIQPPQIFYTDELFTVVSDR